MNNSAILQSIYRHIHQRSVRDLAWALLHPTLFTQLPTNHYENDGFLSNNCLTPDWVDEKLEEWLIALDKNPEALILHLKDQRATRLGIYFEQLLSFYFSHYPRFTLLAKNLQVNGAERTIGEYDFIVEDHGSEEKAHHHEKQYLHIEVAIKFYVGIPDEELSIKNNPSIHNWHYWVGPNKKDTLAIKMDHLFKRQLRLSQIPEGIEALQKIGVDASLITPKLLLTGCLYTPIDGLFEKTLQPTQCEPHYISPNVDLRPTWFSVDKWRQSYQGLLNDDKQYIVLPRQQWMSPITVNDKETLQLPHLSKEQLITVIEQVVAIDGTPLHVSEINHPSSDICIENKRFFVLP